MIQLKINNMDHKAVLTVPADYERVTLALWTLGLDRDPEKYTLRQLDAEFTYTTEEESQMVRLIDPRSSLTDIVFPYHNIQRIVVFGGHDSWAREIKPRLPDVRFVDKDMVPNAELIRRAEIVWIQANAISHAYYYKILDETRKHSIPVRFFSYASALKCAEQLAEQDMKEAQK